MTASRPAVVVLTEQRSDRPPELTPLSDRVEWRFTDAEGLGDALEGARALLLWDFFSTALERSWHRADGLEWIHVAAAGIDSLLFDDLRDSPVVVTNARGTFDRPIAEFVLASVLAHAKLLHASRELQLQRIWHHRESLGVAGRRVLVVGTGAIGRQIGALLRAVGMNVQLAGRSERTDPDFGQILASADLPEHVGEVDYLINAAPLTAATRGMFDDSVFSVMRQGSHFVNIGRGPSVVEADLVRALHDGPLDGASLDVFVTEPLPAQDPLWSAPGIVISPHMSGDIIGWRDALGEQFTQNLQRWLDGRDLVNVVDKALGFVSGNP